MESSPLECDICNDVFREDNPPRLLPCSHTFCGHCIDGIIATQKKTCPKCRGKFTAASAEDFTINRSLLEAAERFGSMSVKPRGAEGSSLGFTKESEQKSTEDSITEAEIERLKEMKDVITSIEILSEMRGSFIDMKNGIEGSMEKLREMKLSNDNVLDIIDKDIKRLKDRMSLISRGEEKTQGAEAGLESEIDSTSSGPVMDGAEEVLQEGQEKVKRHKGLLQETQRRRNYIVKEIIKTRNQLDNIAVEIQKALEVDPLVISAVKVIGGKQIVAPFRVTPENQVQLSHFAEGDVPPKSIIIKHEALMETSSRRAFLDLAAGNDTLGRIIIKVMDESNLALNFLHLCAGDLGPSYADSHFSGVGRRGQDGEYIWVDGYKTSGGKTSTSAIMKQIDWKKEEQREIYKRTPFKAGEVRGVFSEGEASKFCIVTRDHPTWSNKDCFGIVEEGLDVLRDAILRYPDIKAVRIVDCGLLLST